MRRKKKKSGQQIKRQRTMRLKQKPRKNKQRAPRHWFRKNVTKISICFLVFWLAFMMVLMNYLMKFGEDEAVGNAVVDAVSALKDELVQNVKNAKMANAKNGKRKNESLPQTKNEISQSRHWRHSFDYNDDAGKRASYLFRDVCVVKKPRPRHSKEKHVHETEWIYISEEKPVDVSFTLGVGPHAVDSRLYFEPVHFTKEEFQSLYPTVMRQNGTSVVFYEYNAQNFGHALSDVFLPIYSALEAFDKVSNDVKLFRYSIRDSIGNSCDWQKVHMPSHYKSCKRMYELQTPLVSKYPVIVLNASLHSVDVPICFDQVIVGISQYSDDCDNGHCGRTTKVRSNELNCMSGRQNQMWNFRANGMKNFGVENIPPIKHQIVVTKRTGGVMSRGFNNLDDLVIDLKQIFGDENVLFVDWSKINMTEQLRIISQTTVHITPPGGVSFISFFLPRWSTSIRLYSSEYLLEWNFFNYLAFMQPEYVNCAGGNINITAVEKLVVRGIKRYNRMSRRKITFDAQE